MYCSVMVEPPWTTPGLDVEDHRAGDCLVIHAVVLVETLVLDGHGGLLHDLRDLAALDELAVLRPVQFSDDRAVPVVDDRVDGRRVLLQLLEGRKIAGEGVDGAGGDGQSGDHREQDDDDEDLHEQPFAAARLGALLLALALAPWEVFGLYGVSLYSAMTHHYTRRGTRRPRGRVHAGARLGESSPSPESPAATCVSSAAGRSGRGRSTPRTGRRAAGTSPAWRRRPGWG